MRRKETGGTGELIAANEEHHSTRVTSGEYGEFHTVLPDRRAAATQSNAMIGRCGSAKQERARLRGWPGRPLKGGRVALATRGRAMRGRSIPEDSLARRLSQ